MLDFVSVGTIQKMNGAVGLVLFVLVRFLSFSSDEGKKSLMLQDTTVFTQYNASKSNESSKLIFRPCLHF